MSEEKSILITGVTSGIGHEVMKLCLAEDIKITGVVRTAQQLEQFAKEFPSIKFLVADLSDPNQVQSLVSKLKTQQFDYILLNAGYAQVGTFHELSEDSIDVMININLLTNMKLVHALLPRALDVGSKITMVSSMVAHMPGGNYASYAVSKAGLSHFHRCLRREYPKLPLLCIEIGAVDTPMHEKSGNKVTNKKMFKSRDMIAQKLWHAVKHQTGVKTLSWDWMIIRRILKMIG